MNKANVKLYISPFMLRIIKEFKRKIHSETNDDYDYPINYELFSSHDTYLSPLLIALGIIDIDCLVRQAIELEDQNCGAGAPPVASSAIFSLRRTKEGKFMVDFEYNGKFMNPCKLILKSKGFKYKGVVCSFKHFEKIVKKKLIFTNWIGLCKWYEKRNVMKVNWIEYVFGKNTYINVMGLWSVFLTLLGAFFWRKHSELKGLQKGMTDGIINKIIRAKK